jgi:membrane protease YdiL (CAAX protease family)
MVPAPSVGAFCALTLFPDAPLGKAIFAASKVWLFAFPVFWLKFVEKEPVSLSPARRGGWGLGLASGLAIAALIVGGYRLLGGYLIDKRQFMDKMTAVGLARPLVYAGAAAYWILVNSVLEEYVWRWFCVRQCESLFSPRVAVAVSALCFTLHHVVALSAYMSLPANLLCSFGVFVGGLIWSAMYLRCRSVWPGYLSHALADLALFGVGAWIIFS